MIETLSHLTDINFFCLLCLVLIGLSVLVIYLIGHCVPIEVRYQDNPVIGSVASLIGIIYGVLAGLMALYLINNISYTGDAVEHEAHAIAGIYRDSLWLREPTRTEISKEVRAYIEHVVNVEWILMADGRHIDSKSSFFIDKMSKDLSVYPIKNNSDLLIVGDMLESIRTLFNARGQRIHMSYAKLNPGIWVVMLLGTLLTLSINYLFGMNRILHILVVSAAALMTASMIYLLLTLDRPFEGEFAIQPDGFLAVLNVMDHQNHVAQIRPLT